MGEYKADIRFAARNTQRARIGVTANGVAWGLWKHFVSLGVQKDILQSTLRNTHSFFGLTGASEPSEGAACCLSVVDISMALNDATVEALPS